MEKQTIDYGKIYSELRTELNGAENKNDKTKGWAIAAAAGFIAIMLKFVTSKFDNGAIITNSWNAMAIAIICGSAINFVFWKITISNSQSIVRAGSYLLFLEYHHKLSFGWEHFIWSISKKKKHLVPQEVEGNPIPWIAAAYCLGSFLMICYAKSFLAILCSVVCVILLLCGLWERKKVEEDFRKKSFLEAQDIYEKREELFQKLKEHYSSSLSEQNGPEQQVISNG